MMAPLDQRYELLDVIGSGGQGVVWRARDRIEGRLVAVKLLEPSKTGDPDRVRRLLRERDVLDTLRDTAAVRLLETCESSFGLPCLVMELLVGDDLETYLAETERCRAAIEFERVRDVLSPVVQTLHRAHQHGIIHCDLKPANIFLLADGGVRMIDFGFVHIKGSERATSGDVVMGSPCYIAPEVWLGHGAESDERVDVYALGVIVYRMLGGRPPFETPSLVEMLPLVTQAPRPSLHALRPALPAAIDDWVERALAVDPQARFASVHALWDALLRALEHSRRLSWSATLEPAKAAWRKAGELVSRLATLAPGPPADQANGAPDREAIPDTLEPVSTAPASGLAPVSIAPPTSAEAQAASRAPAARGPDTAPASAAGKKRRPRKKVKTHRVRKPKKRRAQKRRAPASRTAPSGQA